MTSIKEKLKEKVGVTFNGNVTFNGPMFDIHDNQQVTVVSELPKGEEAKKTDVSIDEDSDMPEDLATQMATKYWNRLKKAGFTDENHQLCPGVSRKQAMYIALSFAEKLDLQSKWKPFEQLWKKNNLAQEKYNMNESGIMPLRHKEIDKIFSD